MPDLKTWMNNLLPHDSATEANAFDFAVRGILAGRSHIEPCVVTEVNDDKTINVLLLLSEILADGTKASNSIVRNVKYWRLQAGYSAVTLTPRVSDIGLLMVCDRDISNLESGQTEDSAPPSQHRSNLASSVYLGSIAALMTEPSEYIEFTGSGINSVASEFTFTCGSQILKLSSSGLTHNGVNIGSTHVHGGVESGSSETEVPQ